jgi:hypothetical protein
MYDGHSDPKQFLMSYEATISSYDGNTTFLFKSIFKFITKRDILIIFFKRVYLFTFYRKTFPKYP